MSKHVYGFTGTRAGMTTYQKLALLKILEESDVVEFHHGDCMGADAEAHEITLSYPLEDIRIVIHPPDNPKHRAYKFATGESLPPKPYIDRNHDIVDACDVLIAAPKEMQERLRSGTWATVRYARKVGKPVVILPLLEE